MNLKHALPVLLAALPSLVNAETFIGPTTTTNQLLMPTNSAIIITTTLNGWGDFGTRVVLNGSTSTLFSPYPVERGEPGYALAGPAELILSSPVVLTFYRLTNSSIHSLIVGTTNAVPINIPSNKTVRFFPLTSVLSATLQTPTGTANINRLEATDDIQITGPATFSLFSPFDRSVLVSYFVADDGFTIPDQRVIVGPTGSFAIAVEKSTDLSVWSPVLLHNASDPDKAFYRLRLQR